MPRLGPFLQLSREHHDALLLARDCGRFPATASATDAAAMNRRISGYWSAEMAEHFVREEALLHNFAAALASADQARLLDDHARLRAACTVAADAGLDAEAIRNFGVLLAAHVRFEERHCFPALQRVWEGSAPDEVPERIDGRTDGEP